MTDGDLLRETQPAYHSGGPPAPLPEYLRQLERNLQRGDATEHTHRPALKAFLEALDDTIVATNEPRRSQCGAPDYVVSRKRDHLSLGYLEAKDIGADLEAEGRGEQLARYLGSLSNLLLTDYLEFHWFVEGKPRATFRLGTPQPGGKIVPAAPAEQERALHLLHGYLTQRPVDITSADELARRLARLTHIIRDVITGAFRCEQASPQLRDWRNAFATTLLPELASHADTAREAAAVSEFADMFAQTLTYGLFSARATSGSHEFTREKAQKLIPRTNPFLRTFFEQITGTALDDEPFAGFVEDLIQTLNHADMARVMADFGKHGPHRDPVVHFYETFLHAYDPKLRELRGVYYTPEPVVSYIVQSIDRLLKDKFGIKAGLADHQKLTVKRKVGEVETTEETHRVLILDPATGTATFLYSVLDFIRSQFKTKKNAGQWGSYVHEHLLPRLFGFELLMAPYAVAHFKIGLALAAMDEEPLFRQEWSYQPQGNERVNIFLTNTLEDLEHTTEQLGPLRALSNEANAAYAVKQHKPVLVVLGNPPYSGHSANTGEWISKLVRDYYFCDGKPLGERNPKWLQNDYVKFIRWSQWRIAQTGQGVLGFITSNSYLDSPTFRGMRHSLLQTFDEIYLLDLHGNANKREVVPGTNQPDKNVFDISEGVSIALFVKHPPDRKRAGGSSAVVRHAEVWNNSQAKKLEWLAAHQVENTPWKKLSPESPNYLFIPQDNKRKAEYERGWKVTDMMPVNVLGFQSHRDKFALAFTHDELRERMAVFRGLTYSDAEIKERLEVSDSGSWKVAKARVRIRADQNWEKEMLAIDYHPFDSRWCYYNTAAVDRPRPELATHVARQKNICMSLMRQTKAVAWHHAFAGTAPAAAVYLEIKDGSTVFPLYLYPSDRLPEAELFGHDNGRRPNLSADFIQEFCARLDCQFVPDGLGRPGKREVGPECIFNYAYAVFHSPSYRERYVEFLRADFPRLPLTSNWELHRTLAELGLRLVSLHARGEGEGEGPGFPIAGDNLVTDLRYQSPQGRELGRVWINATQYFDGVTEGEWKFPIGGYLPAQRWLKDRKKRKLTFEDIRTYGRIIYALSETGRLMAQIDQAIEQHGGWPLK